METTFLKLNENWNAYPNGSESFVTVRDDNIEFRFELNPYLFRHIKKGDFGILIFTGCAKYRLGSPNDEGFYMGQCRFSKLCPQWGEFYEVTGDQVLLNEPIDWILTNGNGMRHFLFYLRDEAFECTAKNWEFQYADC